VPPAGLRKFLRRAG
jgi:adenosylhomocysteine nucleosidase